MHCERIMKTVGELMIHDTTMYLPLVERIKREATVVDGRILKIDHFLNHRIEPGFMHDLGAAMAERLRPYRPDLILTAEASGIAPALATSLALGVPLVYAKKYPPLSVEPPALSRIVPSPTKGGDVRLAISTRYLTPGLRVAIVDDFLANGRTALALAEMIADADSQPVAAGFIVEKRFQQGRAPIEARGVPVIALASIARLEGDRVVFAEE